MISLSTVAKLFYRIQTPRYLDVKIQEIALSHLEVKDLGELRDMYDAQTYLNRLTDEIRSEYAFEKFLGIEFDYRKRIEKKYPRLHYSISGVDFQISYFNSKTNPIILSIKPTVLVFLKPEKSAFIGPLLNEEQVENAISNELNPIGRNMTIDLDKINFEKCIFFSDMKELKKTLENLNT